jgi:PAS domain S-box-containing protein
MEAAACFVQDWGYVTVNSEKIIEDYNRTAELLMAGKWEKGIAVTVVMPWLRKDWLCHQTLLRVIKTSLSDKYLLHIYWDSDNDSWHLFFRSASDYYDGDHLWCEVAGSIIGVQRFIDTSYDGIIVADGLGNILAVNDAFTQISGLSAASVIGKNDSLLLAEKLVNHSCILQVAKCGETTSAVVKYTTGKEAIVTSTPLFDNDHKIVRILSNVRDMSELNALHKKLTCLQARAHGFERELKAIQAAQNNVERSMVRSQVMEKLYDLVTKVADTDLQILFTGDSGVGKTALAKFVHILSERRENGHFIHVNCSAIPEPLLESELFGHEEGSFTGAKKHKIGLFEMADQGTLFLDEIGDMPLSFQAKLLNVLQEHKFYRVGGTKEIKVDVRIIAATNTCLEDLVTRGRFRQDLYYRLNVIPIRIPSLAERSEDILPLVAYYLEKSNLRYKREKTFAPDAMNLLLEYAWPGNIRELVHTIERLVVLVDGSIIECNDLPHTILQAAQTAATQRSTTERKIARPAALWRPDTPLKQLVAQAEAAIIEEALAYSGSLKETAENLSVDVTTLIRKRNRYCKKDPLKGKKKTAAFAAHGMMEVSPLQ